MSDSSSFQVPEIRQALTGDMLLGLKPAAPKSRSYRISVAPTNNSVFVGGQQCIFELPVGRRGTWLDQSQSYLKFSVQFASTAACTAVLAANLPGTGPYIENTAYSFIQRMDIYNSSNLLETINEYGQLANFLLDTSLTQSDKAGLSTMLGTNPFTYTNLAANAANGAGINTFNTTIISAGDRSGLSVASVAVAAGISTAIPYTFSLPLLSGVIGINASKMLPVGKLHNPIHVEMYWAANDDAIYYGQAGAGTIWQIVNVEFCACYVELQNDEIDNINDDMPHYISTTTYRQSSSTLTAASNGEYTTLLPFRCSSLTAIYARFRPFVSAVQGANGTAAYRKSASINPNFGSYYFRIANSIYPNKPVYLINGSNVGTGGEAYAELLKSFHALSSSIGNSCITFNNYNVAATATQGWAANYVPVPKTVGPLVDTFGNAFAIGIELQTFSNRNDTILSGISTQNNQVYFTGNIYTGLTAGGANNYNYTCDFFAQMDMLLMLENGILTARY
jgi:hypothetical protein